MLNIGIIGNKNLDYYVNVINDLPFYQLKAIFDPSFQVEKNISPYKSITEYNIEDFLTKCDTVIFSSENRLYYNQIERAIKKGKAIFLHSTSNLSLDEHKKLNKLTEEAKEIIQIFHPYLYVKSHFQLNQNINKPILYNVINTGTPETKLLLNLRQDISALLAITKPAIKHTLVQTHAIQHDFPDVYSINIKFDNGASANFIADSIGDQRKHQISAYLHNNLKQINLCYSDENIKKQLTDFYNNVLYAKTPLHGIENELRTQVVIEKVKEKVRFSFNIV